MKNTTSKTKILTSLAILIASFGLTYAPLPGSTKTVTIVAGSELKEPLEAIEATFEQNNPQIKLELKIQGSQDIINNFVDKKNDFTPTVLIPANEELIKELETRLQAQGETQPFYNNPQPIAKTMLVGIAWPERGNILFPNGRFEWQNIEQAMQKRNWQAIAGKPAWGSFDFVITDPTRSNSGQLTLSLWSESILGKNNLNANDINNPKIQQLFGLIKNSVYQPPRSTDVLLQEFITRGSNDADVGIVYESIAIYRWSQSNANQSTNYQIYYLNPTIETVATATIMRRDVNKNTAKAAQKFLDFLMEIDGQKMFATYGFRPIVTGIQLNSIPHSPWAESIPGVEINPSLKTSATPSPQVINEIQRVWHRAN